MTFSKGQQPNHDRAKAARKADTPWRKSTTLHRDERSHRHKFHARPTEHDGIRFDSKKEADYYDKLKLRVAAGEVLFFLRQTTFHLPGGTRYVVDFTEFRSDGSVHFVDVKGMKTDVFKVKKREVEAAYPVTIEVV